MSQEIAISLAPLKGLPMGRIYFPEGSEGAITTPNVVWYFQHLPTFDHWLDSARKGAEYTKQKQIDYLIHIETHAPAEHKVKRPFTIVIDRWDTTAVPIGKHQFTVDEGGEICQIKWGEFVDRVLDTLDKETKYAPKILSDILFNLNKRIQSYSDCIDSGRNYIDPSRDVFPLMQIWADISSTAEKVSYITGPPQAVDPNWDIYTRYITFAIWLKPEQIDPL